MSFFLTLILSSLISTSAIYVHELGHRRKAQSLGYKSKIVWEEKNPTTIWYGKPNNREDNIKIIRHGVFIGACWLFACSLLIAYFDLLAIIISTIIYAVGCMHDVKALEALGVQLIETED